MKKILLLILTVLTFTSCAKTFRNDDFFIIVSKEISPSCKEYKYLYRANHYTILPLSKNKIDFSTEYIFLMNENYELGDTIKFIR